MFAASVLIALYWKSGTLLTAQAFTAISLSSILTSPMIQLVQVMPQLHQCIGNFDRIQEYCMNSDHATRMETQSGAGCKVTTAISLPTLTSSSRNRGPGSANEVIVLRNNSFAWPQAPLAFMTNVNLTFHQNSLTICVGAVGSGKTMLLESILGETICTSGPRPKYDSAIAHCAQQPWLQNDSIRSNVIGAANYDAQWYETVLTACGLEADLQALDDGDQTLLGSKGFNVSGGQKQRIVSISP